jgi:hypothetical protein
MLLLAAAGTLVQPAAAQQPAARVYKPVYLLNSRIVFGDSVLRQLKPTEITGVMVYKGSDGTPANWRSLAKHGIIALALPPSFKPKSRSLAAIRRRLKVRGPVRFELDELPLEDTMLRIATVDIAGLDVTPPLVAGGSTVINIRLLRLRPRPSTYPPGTIFVRGAAAL